MILLVLLYKKLNLNQFLPMNNTLLGVNTHDLGSGFLLSDTIHYLLTKIYVN